MFDATNLSLLNPSPESIKAFKREIQEIKKEALAAKRFKVKPSQRSQRYINACLKSGRCEIQSGGLFYQTLDGKLVKPTNISLLPLYAQ